MFSIVAGNDWTTFDLEVYKKPAKEFPDDIGLPCLSFGTQSEVYYRDTGNQKKFRWLE